MADLLIAAALLLMVAAAVRYIIKAKRNGSRCIGCPAEGGCPHRRSQDSACGGCCGKGTEACNTKPEK